MIVMMWMYDRYGHVMAFSKKQGLEYRYFQKPVGLNLLQYYRYLKCTKSISFFVPSFSSTLIYYWKCQYKENNTFAILRVSSGAPTGPGISAAAKYSKLVTSL